MVQGELQELREALKASGYYNEQRHTELYLTRFLRSRSNDVDLALEKLINTEEWRKRKQVDKIVKEFAYTEYADVHEIYPRFYHGTDRAGRPVYYEQLKNLDYKQLMSVTDPERFEKHCIRESEKLSNYRVKACSAKLNKQIWESTSIIDLKNAPFSQFKQLSGYIKQIADICSEHYPETMAAMLVINAPSVFTMLWKVIKKFLDPKTAEKIRIVGTNYEQSLLEHISPENIPSFYGGDCQCSGGCENSDLGPWNDRQVPGVPDGCYSEFYARDTK